MMRRMLLRGKDAESTIRSLIDDPSEDVRRVTVRHLTWRSEFVSDRVTANEMPVELVVSLLEHALDSGDPHIRSLALRGLATNAQYNREARERVAQSLPKIRQLGEDNNGEIRREAVSSLRLILEDEGEPGDRGAAVP
jgi:hypothetical protein